MQTLYSFYHNKFFVVNHSSCFKSFANNSFLDNNKFQALTTSLQVHCKFTDSTRFENNHFYDAGSAVFGHFSTISLEGILTMHSSLAPCSGSGIL